MVSVSVKSIGATVSVIYCLPDLKYENFKEVIDIVKHAINKYNDKNPMKSENIIMGNLNFPNNG